MDEEIIINESEKVDYNLESPIRLCTRIQKAEADFARELNSNYPNFHEGLAFFVRWWAPLFVSSSAPLPFPDTDFFFSFNIFTYNFKIK